MKKISLCVLSCLLLSCSIPNQDIKQTQSTDKTEIQNNKFKVKTLAKFEHPNNHAEFNDLAYQYAFTDITSGHYNHYSYARNSEYQPRIRSAGYLLALKCIDEGFEETSYRMGNPDIQAAITNGNLPSAYAHYKTVRAGEPSRVTSQAYKNALKTNKVFREEAYYIANPNIHSTIKLALDNNFTSVNHVNGYEHYMLNKSSTSNPLDNSVDPLNNTNYQTALNDHIDGYWEDSYLYAFNDILSNVDSGTHWISRGYLHYNYYGRNESRLSQPAYINALNVGIHPGQSKVIDFEEGVLGSNPSTSNQKRILTFNVLPNRKYRFWLAEISEGDSHLTIKDQSGNIVTSNDDTYGLDGFVEFTAPNTGTSRYTVEATTSNNGTPSTTPAGKFILTMFHEFK